jgi:hypothetical protein
VSRLLRLHAAVVALSLTGDRGNHLARSETWTILSGRLPLAVHRQYDAPVEQWALQYVLGRCLHTYDSTQDGRQPVEHVCNQLTYPAVRF